MSHFTTGESSETAGSFSILDHPPSKPGQTSDVESRDSREAVRFITALRSAKARLHKIRTASGANVADEVVERPPDSSTVAPSHATFIDPDNSVWSRAKSVVKPVSKGEYTRIPNCDETNSAPSDSGDAGSAAAAADLMSVNSREFQQVGRSYKWRGIRLDLDGFRMLFQYREEIWEDHKEWLAKRYGKAHSEMIVKFIERSRYDFNKARRVLMETLSLRDEEERKEWVQFLLDGANAAHYALMERDLDIWAKNPSLKRLQVFPNTSDAGDGHASKATDEKFEQYTTAWDTLLNPSTDVCLTFQTVPWPTVANPRSPEEIVTFDVWDFLLDGHFGSTHRRPAYCRLAANEELMRWNPDRVMTFILPRVAEAEREEVRMGADIVFKSLIVLRSFSVCEGEPDRD